MHYQIINNNDGKRAGKILNFSLHYSRFIVCKTQREAPYKTKPSGIKIMIGRLNFGPKAGMK